MPQKRHRVLILGIRSDIEKRPSLLSAKKVSTVRHVLEELPALRSGVSKTKLDDNYENWSMQ